MNNKYGSSARADRPGYMSKQARVRTLEPDRTMGFGDKMKGREVTLVKGTKPPPMRFKIGSYVKHEGWLYEVMYAYRVVTDPHEWIYCLEVRKGLDGSKDAIGRIAEAMGCGETTPRVVYDLFRTSYEANSFFGDIPSNGDRTLLKNKEMMAEAEVVSSGQVIK